MLSSTPVTITSNSSRTPCRRGSRLQLLSTPSSDCSETSRTRTPGTQKSAKDNNCREGFRSSLPKPGIISPEVPTQKTQSSLGTLISDFQPSIQKLTQFIMFH